MEIIVNKDDLKHEYKNIDLNLLEVKCFKNPIIDIIRSFGSVTFIPENSKIQYKIYSDIGLIYEINNRHHTLSRVLGWVEWTKGIEFTNITDSVLSCTGIKSENKPYPKLGDKLKFKFSEYITYWFKFIEVRVDEVNNSFDGKVVFIESKEEVK